MAEDDGHTLRHVLNEIRGVDERVKKVETGLAKLLAHFGLGEVEQRSKSGEKSVAPSAWHGGKKVTRQDWFVTSEAFVDDDDDDDDDEDGDAGRDADDDEDGVTGGLFGEDIENGGEDEERDKSGDDGVTGNGKEEDGIEDERPWDIFSGALFENARDGDEEGGPRTWTDIDEDVSVGDLFGEDEEGSKGVSNTADANHGDIAKDRVQLQEATLTEDLAIRSWPQPSSPTAPPKSYVYEPLDATISQIRILALEPTNDLSSPVVATLSTASLDDQIVGPGFSGYTALSYCWGPPIFSSYIILNNTPFPVTQSLETALRYMRPKKTSTPSFGQTAAPLDFEMYVAGGSHWWIDQICINQEDIDERTSQVNLMRRIYKRASSVSVWLGEDADDSDLAVEVIETLGRPPMHAPGEKAISYPLLEEKEVERRWLALEKLFARPWWERVWIRQEVALSYSVKLFVGEKGVDMEVLKLALTGLEYVQSLGYAAPHVKQSLVSDDAKGTRSVALSWTHHPQTLSSLHSRTNGGSSWVELEAILPNARSCKATDPRDTVFSVLGLCDPEVYQVTANYRQQLREVFVAATAAVLENEHGLDVLGACQNPERKGGLPSWVPNLIEPWKAMPFSVNEVNEKRRNLELRISDYEPSSVMFEDETLLIQGGVVDSIAHICNIVVEAEADADGLDRVYYEWRAWIDRAARERKLDDIESWDYSVGPRSDAEELDRYKLWVRFLSVLKDEPKDIDEAPERQTVESQKKAAEKLQPHPKKKGGKTRSTKSVLKSLEERLERAQSPYHLNLKLCRSHLLPSTFVPSLHPNQRIHAGLRANGPGRRLALTKRGMLALVPGDVQVNDGIALFLGASFPYLMRKAPARKNSGDHVLVGEAFVPRFPWGEGTRLAREEYGIDMDGYVRLI